MDNILNAIQNNTFGNDIKVTATGGIASCTPKDFENDKVLDAEQIISTLINDSSIASSEAKKKNIK